MLVKKQGEHCTQNTEPKKQLGICACINFIKYLLLYKCLVLLVMSISACACFPPHEPSARDIACSTIDLHPVKSGPIFVLPIHYHRLFHFIVSSCNGHPVTFRVPAKICSVKIYRLLNTRINLILCQYFYLLVMFEVYLILEFIIQGICNVCL